MKVVAYPADQLGCGHHRLIWPIEELRRQGHDVQAIGMADHLDIYVDRDQNSPTCGHAVDAKLRWPVDVVVLQRSSHLWLAESIPFLTREGVAVVVDIDDDLSRIHPENPAWDHLHPQHQNQGHYAGGKPHLHSWHNLMLACANATLVTVSCPGLLKRYATRTPGRVLYNYLPEHYFGISHIDNTEIGWPATIWTHPNDPSVVGGSIARLLREQPSTKFRMIGDATGAGRAFSLPEDPPFEMVPLLEWPKKLTELGIGIAPLADTQFNASKSWLKPLEMSAVGVPWVASPRAEYTRLHKHGVGILAETHKDWYRELKRLLGDAGLREEQSAMGREVTRQLHVKDHVHKVWEAWSHAMELAQKDQAPVSVSS